MRSRTATEVIFCHPDRGISSSGSIYATQFQECNPARLEAITRTNADDQTELESGPRGGVARVCEIPTFGGSEPGEPG